MCLPVNFISKQGKDNTKLPSPRKYFIFRMTANNLTEIRSENQFKFVMADGIFVSKIFQNLIFLEHSAINKRNLSPPPQSSLSSEIMISKRHRLTTNRFKEKQKKPFGITAFKQTGFRQTTNSGWVRLREIYRSRYLQLRSNRISNSPLTNFTTQTEKALHRQRLKFYAYDPITVQHRTSQVQKNCSIHLLWECSYDPTAGVPIPHGACSARLWRSQEHSSSGLNFIMEGNYCAYTPFGASQWGFAQVFHCCINDLINAN